MTGRRRAVLIAGPTASGKSALALALAKTEDAVIINVDSMQVYDRLQVITARPGEAEMAAVDHRLYGTVPATTRFSTGLWLSAVQQEIARSDQTLIFVGGTGLYFDALINGFADAPEMPAEIIRQVQQEIQGLDDIGRLDLLRQDDPEMATRLRVADPQRVVRALAVKRMTGRSLAHFQDAPQMGGLVNFDIERMVIDPGRDVLRARIARRFVQMLEDGAVEEVRALFAMRLDPALPVMKAIGVREIGGWLAGKMSQEEAVKLSIIATQQYAKRQRTWFRNRFADWPRRKA